jgi:hypothetical protein
MACPDMRRSRKYRHPAHPGQQLRLLRAREFSCPNSPPKVYVVVCTYLFNGNIREYYTIEFEYVKTKFDIVNKKSPILPLFGDFRLIQAILSDFGRIERDSIHFGRLPTYITHT